MLTQIIRGHMSFVVGLVFLAIYPSACSFSLEPLKFSEDKRAAEALVERFHHHFNQRSYDEMYKLFTDNGRDFGTQQQFVDQIQAHREKAGLIVKSRIVRSDVRVVGGARLVRTFYMTEFENSSLLEEFDCLIKGETALIDFYGHPSGLPPSSN